MEPAAESPSRDSVLARMGVSEEEAFAAAAKVQAMQGGKLARQEMGAGGAAADAEDAGVAEPEPEPEVEVTSVLEVESAAETAAVPETEPELEAA